MVNRKEQSAVLPEQQVICHCFRVTKVQALAIINEHSCCCLEDLQKKIEIGVAVQLVIIALISFFVRKKVKLEKVPR